MTVHRIGLVVHGGREEAAGATDRVRAWCAEHDVECVDIDVWDAAGGSTPARRCRPRAIPI